jgi:hypothetical protein
MLLKYSSTLIWNFIIVNIVRLREIYKFIYSRKGLSTITHERFQSNWRKQKTAIFFSVLDLLKEYVVLPSGLDQKLSL